MNQFFDETEHHRKYNSHQQHHHNDVNQGFPLLDAHHVLSRDNNNKNNQPTSASSAVKEQPSRTITMMSTAIPNLGNIPLTEQSETKTDSSNGVNAIHGTTNNNDALSENGDRRLRMLEKNRRAGKYIYIYIYIYI